MKKIVFLLLVSFSVFSQTGIGTTTPNASAKLDVYSTNKGFLPPRVTLTSVTDATTIASPAEGLLVYNLGSVGLQAGYYYWNGANWATIATATSAGNGVTASDMVKIYDGVGNSATINSNGATFSVTTSGKYLFDFSTSATCGNCDLEINFQVRDGGNNNAVIASDKQKSYSNNVHAEYNGKVEVNLVSGRSYNVLVNTTSGYGGIYNNDYSRVYMKQVSGNLPVTGQSVDYVQASLSSNQTLSAAGNIIFNTSSGAGITLSSGGFNLMANKTYKLEAAIGGVSGGYAYYAWVDNANAILPGGSVGAVIKAGNVHTDAPQDNAVVYFTPTSNATVYLRVYNLSGALIAYAPSLATNYSSTWASIQQVGSSAFVNPWTLSGTNTYNTSGNVGIGITTPTNSLHIENGNNFGSDPSNTSSPSLYILNNNNASTNAHASLTIRTKESGGGNPFLSFDILGVKGYSMGIDNADADKFKIHNNWNLNNSNTPIITLTNDARVGIGTASPGAALHVASNVSQYVGSYGYLNSGGASTFTLNGNMAYSIQSDARIRASEFNAISDFRIKKDISKSNTLNQLTELNKLNVVNYKYIDILANGIREKTGFIAQEVESVKPEIVNQSADFIPSFFDKAKTTTLHKDLLVISTDKTHGFKKGDLVKFYIEGKKELIKTIEEVQSPTIFSIKNEGESRTGLFIYGKKVNDFRAIDFDQITALSVGAIQELSKKIEQLEAENESLKKVIRQIEINISKLRVDYQR